MHWHIITSEYPPQPGGVSDYTAMVAHGLADAGDDVAVWCPPAVAAPLGDGGVKVRRELGAFARADLTRVSVLLNAEPAPRRLLLQWVPHGFGWRSMNLPFCRWLLRRARRHGDQVDIMVHEPYLAFRPWHLRQNAAALVHRWMTVTLLRAATRVWTSIPAWQNCWQPYTLGRKVPFGWLPIPSSIPVVDDPTGVATLRRALLPREGRLLGHCGTYGPIIGTLLRAALPAVLERSPETQALLIGRGSDRFRAELLAQAPHLAGRISATGPLDAALLSRHLSACDLMLQPYADGLSTRRTSAMACLAHGRPVVSTTGRLTEPLWQESNAVRLAPVEDIGTLVQRTCDLLKDEGERTRVGNAGRALHQARFNIAHTIAALRGV